MDGKQVAGKLLLSGSLEFRDKDGNVLKVVEMRGAIPLDSEGVAEAQKLMEGQHGTDDCK